MGVKYIKDSSGKLEDIANKIIKKEPEYSLLKHLNILYIWREGKPRKDDGGNFIAAEVSILSKKINDIFNYDVQVEVCQDIWDKLSPSWRTRLLWHELYHIYVESEEDDSGKLIPLKDPDGRIILRLNPHDISLKTFRAEIDKFGIDVGEINTLKFIAKKYKLSKKGKIPKYVRPTILSANAELESDE
jgi:hypothetical protein